MRRALAAVALVAAACETDDVGKPCPALEIPTEAAASNGGDVMVAQGSEVVEYNTDFPCRDIVCVATPGRGAYCSRECATDGNCPSAFACEVVMDFGPFAGRTYCVWRPCTDDADCGDANTYTCEEVPELTLEETVMLCDWL
ncbi:MAG: hypothetical protein HYZ27_12470 [Deltaproteobacteria bacterium]|nr:hypothetical protein [Deltaproteobacteria bacterium]